MPLAPVKIMLGDGLFWQTVVAPEIIAMGNGLTVTVDVIGVPGQLLAVGVMVKVTVIGTLVVLVNEPLMLPLPEATMPVTVPELSRIQL